MSVRRVEVSFQPTPFCSDQCAGPLHPITPPRCSHESSCPAQRAVDQSPPGLPGMCAQIPMCALFSGWAPMALLGAHELSARRLLVSWSQPGARTAIEKPLRLAMLLASFDWTIDSRMKFGLSNWPGMPMKFVRCSGRARPHRRHRRPRSHQRFRCPSRSRPARSPSCGRLPERSSVSEPPE